MSKRNLLLVVVVLFSVTTLPGCKASNGISGPLLGNAYSSSFSTFGEGGRGSTGQTPFTGGIASALPNLVSPGAATPTPFVTASEPYGPPNPAPVNPYDIAPVPAGSLTYGGPR